MIALVTTAIYAAIAAQHAGLFQPSRFAYFNYLANSFLKGHLSLVELPPSKLDLSPFGRGDGRYHHDAGELPALT